MLTSVLRASGVVFCIMASVFSLHISSFCTSFTNEFFLPATVSHSLLASVNGNFHKLTSSTSLTAKFRILGKYLNDDYSRRQWSSRYLLVTGSSSTDFNVAPSVEKSVPSMRGIQNDASPVQNLQEGSSSDDDKQSPLNKLQSGASSVERLSLYNGKSQASKGLFASGSRRAEVRLPGLVLRVGTDEVLGEGSKSILDTVNSAVAGGFTIIILDSGTEEGVGGARLYESACVLKTLLRGRAELLISERVDIAAAVGAGGVVLSDKGLPALVARNMLQNVTPEVSVLPLVARIVGTTQSALSATASEGADLLILSLPETKDTRILVGSVCERVSVPVFVQASAAVPLSVNTVDSSVLEMWQTGASGMVFHGKDLKDAVRDNILDFAALLVSTGLSFQQRSAFSSKIKDSGISTPSKNVIRLPVKTLDLQAKEILEGERTLLTSMIDVVREAAPEMEEISLLVDAVAQLDELFLLVIVGEFNSGKSSVINSLLGKKFLKEGILPTTNEITVLKYSGNGDDGEERSERHPDGHFMRYLPAELLKQMNLVDTPGTNVLLQRQQRLTEEFVPRADLILFVLSADRPLSESEMSFLRYIRKWGKKIIFILNKADVFSDVTEVEEVVKFITDNVQQLLSVKQSIVYSVSARHALKAKREAIGNGGVINREKLSQSALWKSSGFDRLEVFIKDFLDGSSDAGAERRRLKLETPISIALQLLAACERQLSNEAAKAAADLKVLNGAILQLQHYEKMMEIDAIVHRQRTLDVIEAAKKRADNFVDSTLRLSNIEAAAKYLLGAGRMRSLPVSNAFDNEVIGSAISDVQTLLEVHQSWLETNFVTQVNNYKELVTNHWPELKFYGQQVPTSYQEYVGKQKGAFVVLDGFDTKAATIVLEQEIKEVVLSTFGSLGAAGASASVLTSILPNTVEDLIALGICSAGGLIGVWNLPMKRAEVKRKVQNVANSLARQMETEMNTELKESIERLKMEVNNIIEPYCDAVQAEVDRANKLQFQVQGITTQLQRLRLRVQNLGIL